MANWMKTSIFLTSFFSRNCSGSKPFTSPAMRQENCDASNRVIGPMPLRPAQSASQLAWVPTPSGRHQPDARHDDSPAQRPPPYFFLAWDSMYSMASLHARDLLGVLVRDLDPELLFERHDQLDGVERVGAQVVHERRVRRHLFLVDPELLHDDALDLVSNGHSALLAKAPARPRRTR
jgi:hypothetical protein